MSSPLIRPYTPSDRSACSNICLLTGNHGADATGALTSDSIWGEIFVLPYVDRYPSYAWVVELDVRVLGYIVCAPDTATFENWFSTQYWPERARRFEGAAGASQRERELLGYAAQIGKGEGKAEGRGYVEEYPAHLHINLLPQVQGRGLGRRMIWMLLDQLKREGLNGVHLGASAENHAACAFYEHLGFREIEGEQGVRRFVMDLRDADDPKRKQTL